MQITRMEWEKPVLEALVDALQPSGHVLQIGYSPHGYAATHIQTYHPTTHTLIESDPQLFEEATQACPTVNVLFGSWKDLLPTLGQFDTIFFDDSTFAEDTRSLHAALNSKNELSQWVEQQVPGLNTLHYTDADLDAFYHTTGQQQPHETARFFQELRAQGQISVEQYERLVRDYQLPKTPPVPTLLPTADPCTLFLEACLRNHMRPGSKFSCFSGNPASKYDHPWFFEHIITNPALEYHEHWVPVQVPEACTYYPYDTLLILTVHMAK